MHVRNLADNIICKHVDYENILDQDKTRQHSKSEVMLLIIYSKCMLNF